MEEEKLPRSGLLAPPLADYRRPAGRLSLKRNVRPTKTRKRHNGQNPDQGPPSKTDSTRRDEESDGGIQHHCRTGWHLTDHRRPHGFGGGGSKASEIEPKHASGKAEHRVEDIVA